VNPAETEARQSTLGLARGLLDDTTHLARTEVKLARAEVSANLLALIRPLMLIMMGMLLGVGALFTLLGAFVGWLAPHVGAGAASLIVALATTLVAGILAWSGASTLQNANIAPRQAEISVREDVNALKGKVG